MAAPTVHELREAVAGKLQAALSASANVHAYPDTYAPPVVFVYPRAVDYDTQMARGGDMWEMVVRAVAQNLDWNGQRWLDELANPTGATSVKALLEADQTLGGLARGIRVSRMENYQEYVFEGRAATWGCEFLVFIEATGI